MAGYCRKIQLGNNVIETLLTAATSHMMRGCFFLRYYLISTPHHLFAYCITDGILDEMSPEQRTSIIHIIGSLLSEGEDAISESLLSGEDASACSKKNNYFFTSETK